MSEEIKATIRRLVEEAWHKGNLDVLDEVYDANFVFHRPPFPDIEGIEAYKQYVADFRKGFPDLRFTIDEIIVEGGTSATRYTTQGTHTGQSAILRLPPTGKQVTGPLVTVAHFVDGKVVEEWSYADFLGSLQQLGVIPPMG
jgi:predicted ester cyclase